jgi:hypothetical protein
MVPKFSKILVIVASIFLALSGLFLLPSLEAVATQEDPDGCWGFMTTANNPYRSGSNVYGQGSMSCDNAQERMKIVVTVGGRDAGGVFRGETVAATHYCSNATYCSTTSLPYTYYSNWTYQTRVSSYPNSYESDYVVSSWVSP